MNNTPNQANNNSGHFEKAATNLVPLTVWLCSDTTTKEIGNDTTSKKAPLTCVRHRTAPGWELARHLIAYCTRPGDVVVEAYPSSEAVLVSAWEADRRAVGCLPHFPLAQHIGKRIGELLPAEDLHELSLRACRPDQMNRALADLKGTVGLVIAEPPPFEKGGRVPIWTDQACPACRADFWGVTEERLGSMITASWQVLRPGGVLAVITTARHGADGRLVDPAPRIVRHAAALGFTYSQHVIALRVPIEGDGLAVQFAAEDFAHLRDTRNGSIPAAVSVHADVCLFTKPATVGGQKGDAR
ncbi:hypothetical protein [Actinocorallia longicatena]